VPESNNIDKLKLFLSDKFEIIKLIASGGMGEVYLGIHKKLGKKTAIKIVHQEINKDKEIRQRFLKEAQLAASIDHPGIIQVMDFGSHEDFDYLVMPFIEGKTLSEVMGEKRLKPEKALKLMIPMIEAISYAHRNNIIHRDIKPSNYMIDSQGKIILTDFGISKKIGDVNLTAKNTILGSPMYMSPEQVMGKPVDRRSDLYALGMIFYRMLTGVHPFESEDFTSVVFKHVNQVPENPCQINEDIPEYLGDSIMRLLEKDPDKRFPNGEALLYFLKQAHTEHEYAGSMDDEPTRIVALFPKSQEKVSPLPKPEEDNATLFPKSEEKHKNDGISQDLEKASITKKTDLFGSKRFLSLLALTGVMITGLFLILAVKIFQEDDVIIHVDPKTLKEDHIVRNQDLSVTEKIVPSDLPLLLRSKNQWEQELIDNINNRSRFIEKEDIQRLLKMKLGLSIKSDLTQNLEIKLNSFLKTFPFAQIITGGDCDIIISCESIGDSDRLIIISNIYGYIKKYREEIVIRNNMIPFNQIKQKLKMYYCFYLFEALSQFNSYKTGDKRIDLEVQGKTQTRFTIGESLKFCFRPGIDAHFVLLDINMNGIYKLFPIDRGEEIPLMQGNVQCSQDVNVSLPIGNEMIVAIGASNKDVLRNFIQRYGLNNSIAEWSFADISADNPIPLCEELFSRLINESTYNWCMNTKFITIGENE